MCCGAKAGGRRVVAQVFHASSQLASIRSIDEAVVIGVALSLSSSAFVLQLLGERGEASTKFGSATLGILLMQARPLLPAGWPQALHLASAHCSVPANAALIISAVTADAHTVAACIWTRQQPLLRHQAPLCMQRAEAGARGPATGAVVGACRTSRWCPSWCCCRWWRTAT